MRSAEFGFFGETVLTMRQTPRLNGFPFSAGVAAASGEAADAHVLMRHARRARQEARGSGSGAALHRLERRAHSRILVGTSVAARLRSGGNESEIVIEDLSLGGALLSTPPSGD